MSKRRTHPDQLDLFLHSGAVMLTNDVLDALRARDLERTMRSLERLRARTPAAERWVAGAAALAAAPLALAAYAAWRPGAYLVSLVLAQLLLFAAARAGAAAVAATTPAAGAARAAAAAATAIALLAEAPAAAVVGLLSDRTSLGRALAVLVPLALVLAAGAWIAAARHADRAARGPSSPRARGSPAV